MRCCAFGTIRMDARIYHQFTGFDIYDEIKVDNMFMTVGGSVYNTVGILTRLKCDVVFYMLNSGDDLTEYVAAKMKNQQIECTTCLRDKNKMAATIVFVGDNGKKKMISYDGERQDKYILQKLYRDIEQYDMFYTSFYEINEENCTDIIRILELAKNSFIDLSPLIYEVPSDIISEVLKRTCILSGTQDEYAILFEKLGVTSIKQLAQEYDISMLGIKKGEDGADLYTGKGIISRCTKIKKPARDTTGCGDTFNAGIIYSLDKGYSNNKMLGIAVDMATSVAYYGIDSDEVTDCVGKIEK